MRVVDTVYHWGGLHNSTNPNCFRQRPCRRKGGRSARGGREEPPSPVPPQKPLSLGLGFPRFPRPFLHNIYVDETTSSLTFQEGALLLLSVCPREKSTSPQAPCPVPLQLCCVASPYPFLHARWCVLCMCPVRNRSPICLGQKVEYSLLFLKFKLECATSLATVPLFLVLPWDTHRCRIPCHGHSLILPACRLLFTRTVAVRYSLSPRLRLLFSPRHLL